MLHKALHKLKPNKLPLVSQKQSYCQLIWSPFDKRLFQGLQLATANLIKARQNRYHISTYIYIYTRLYMWISGRVTGCGKLLINWWDYNPESFIVSKVFVGENIWNLGERGMWEIRFRDVMNDGKQLKWFGVISKG